jgi:ubiquinone biosynthesis accessory factor UbiK
MDPFHIDDIVRRLLETVSPGLRSVQEDLESNFRVVLRAALGRLDLVTREEFDTQTHVLERTRAKADAMEARIAELEKRLGG